MTEIEKYDNDLMVIEREAERIKSPEKICEFQILSHDLIKNAILQNIERNKVSYRSFNLRKLSINSATVELLFTHRSSLLLSNAQSVICELEIEEWFFQMLELAYLKGHKVGNTPAMPFILNIPSNAAEVTVPEDEVSEIETFEELYLERLGLEKLDDCPVTTLRETYRRTESRTSQGTTTRCGNPPRDDDSNADGSRADYSQDSLGQDSHCDS